MKGCFITGTDTDVGKTLVSAIFAMALGAEYWKPVQAGTSPNTDSEVVKLLTDGRVKCLPEAHILTHPLSPHKAAELDGKLLRIANLMIPKVETMVVEGAGGVLVPLNDEESVLDLAVKINFPVVLVVRLRLGCINHTLLTLESINRVGLKIKGIVFTDSDDNYSKSEIERLTKLPTLLHITSLSGAFRAHKVKAFAEELKRNMNYSSSE